VILKKSDDATTIDGAGLINSKFLMWESLLLPKVISQVITYKIREILDGYYFFDKKH
jgi:hypothetical protein